MSRGDIQIKGKTMRVVQNAQMQIGEVDISKIVFDPKSRDDIPRILKGLQHLYVNVPVREKIFRLLEAEISPSIDFKNGRPGMELWKILVCGVVQLDLNVDYDRLHELVNHHDQIREMMGHGDFDKKYYHLQTLVDNVGLFKPELLDKISRIVVDAGHDLVIKKGGEALHGRCDSFVVETDVHFPTDINVLNDAMRKIITLTARWCEEHDLSDWRQHAYNVRHVKRLLRSASSKKRSKAQSEEKKAKNEELIVEAHQEYLDVANTYLQKASETIAKIEQLGFTGDTDILNKLEIERYMEDAIRQIDQTERRVMEKEVIPHDEKVFSIFEPHTEWISKGKAGVPVEFGLRVCILEDQYQFILNHQVMENTTDDKVAVSMVEQAKLKFPELSGCSFDKGFHSPENQTDLKEILEQVVLPKKGKLSKLAQAAEHTEEFIKARHAHSAVESAINALEVHGLDMCPNHGIHGFKRYVALAVLTRNIHRIGDILWRQDQKRAQRKQKISANDPQYRRAA
jgi:hypothetical protein